MFNHKKDGYAQYIDGNYVHYYQSYNKIHSISLTATENKVKLSLYQKLKINLLIKEEIQIWS